MRRELTAAITTELGADIEKGLAQLKTVTEEAVKTAAATPVKR